MSFFAEFKKGGEAGYIVRRVDERETEIEGLDQLEVGMTQFEYIYLELWLWCEFISLEEEVWTHLK